MPRVKGIIVPMAFEALLTTMPGVMIERQKMTRAMYQALKRHIMRERDNKKKEQEHDEEMERLKKERELRKKKEEEDSLTLEQTKDQIGQLHIKLESMKTEKHQLFSQLKKVLHQEDESRKRAQLKEHNEMISLQQYHPGIQVPGHIFMQTHMPPRPTKYMHVPVHQPMVPQGVKRQRSPSPPPAAMYQHFSRAAKYPPISYAQVKQEPYQTPKSTSYPTAHSTHVTYAAQSSHVYSQPHTNSQHQAPPTQHQAPPPQHQTPPAQHQAPPTQQPPGGSYPTSQSQSGKYVGSQSAFQSYSTHYAHQQQKPPGEIQLPQGYQVQRLPQPGYLNSPHAAAPSLSLQQQLEHANQKSGFSEDKFKMQQPYMPPQQAAMIVASQQSSPQQPPKGSIVTGYPVRTQPSTSSYQAAPTQSPHSPHAGQPPRHQAYGAQPARSYY